MWKQVWSPPWCYLCIKDRGYVAYVFFFWKIRSYVNVFYFSVRKQEQNTLMAQNTNEEVMNGFNHLVLKLLYPDSAGQVTIVNQLTQFRSGDGIFERPVTKAAASTMPVCQWWLNFGASVPELQEFAVSNSKLEWRRMRLELVWFHTEWPTLQSQNRNTR